MKKIVLPLLLFGLFVANNAHACSPMPDVEYPTIDSLLSANTTAIGLYTPSSDGVEVPAQLYIGNEHASMNITLKSDNTSCGMRSNDFKTNEYIVAIYEANTTVLNHTDLDAQFSIPFLNQGDAIEKYTELFEQWEERVHIIGSVSENGEVSYVSSSSSLRPGMKDDNILALQTALKTKLGLGSEFKLDGSYGPATSAAVKQFQLLHDLEDDGIAGVLTQDKLAGTVIGMQEVVPETNQSLYTGVGYTLRPGMKDDNVLALQTALKEKLGLGNDFKLDGSYGPATSAAVKQFQLLHDLEDDGIAGVLTQVALSGTVVVQNQNNETSTNTETEIETTPVENNSENVNTDIIDTELRKILLRAKNEITRYAIGVLNYTDAHSLVVQYNNELLGLFEGSDPLYKSSHGGEYFVYSAKVSDASYICVDNNPEKQVVERTTRPDSTNEQVSC